MAQLKGDRTEAICRAIRRAIIEGALMPGDRLPEDGVGDSFGVSRTLARHALGQLAAEGLVDLRRNRIATVAAPTPEEARDIFDIRIALERQVVGHLAGVLTEKQAAELRALVEAEDNARHGPDGPAIRLATEFHVRLAEMTEKAILVRYVTEICYRAGLSLSSLARPHSSDCAVSEHLDLIETIRTGPREAAMALMDRHLEAVASRALLSSKGVRTRELADILAPYLN
ncbi:GntR family transcriptional regulator [Haematobacter genomosp. 1]|uniref:GntR family transcriptional regulator n=1 Tax=Haematobacter genomosp. 1 TaxID=366618 RepID=A0A212AAI8_9RHOB|nr:GntR family transcriptional regulator [Haematobacter genomosp. 1]OWJ77246.1 GntR family transcriptional regulator [Haematobacter genomosp. 1]